MGGINTRRHGVLAVAGRHGVLAVAGRHGVLAVAGGWGEGGAGSSRWMGRGERGRLGGREAMR